MANVYWRIYRGTKDNLLHVVCMQDFDEYDYVEHRFATDPMTGERLKFDSEAEAIRYLNVNFRQDYIAEEWLNADGVRLPEPQEAP